MICDKWVKKWRGKLGLLYLRDVTSNLTTIHPHNWTKSFMNSQVMISRNIFASLKLRKACKKKLLRFRTFNNEDANLKKKCFGPIVYCHFDRPWLGYIFWSRYPMQLFCINFHYSSNLRTHLPICTKYFIQPFQTRSYMSGKKWGTNLHTV